MAIVVKQFGLGLKNALTGAIDLDADTFKQMLTLSTWTPNQDTNDFRDDVTNELTADSGYAAGGVTLAGISVTYDSASDQVRFDCNDITYPFSASKTFRRAAGYKSRGGAATADELLWSMEWDSDQTLSTPYTLTTDPAGLLFWDVT
jgi:hypothetical protein